MCATRFPAVRRRPDHFDPWLLPDRQDLGNDAGRPHGLGRIFAPPRPSHLRHRSGSGAAVPPPTRPRSMPSAAARPRADQLPTVFSAGHEGAWAIFRFGKEYPQLMPGMRFPVAAQAEFWKQMVPDSLNSLPTPKPDRPGAFGTGAEDRRHGADEPFAVRHLPVSNRGSQPQRHRWYRVHRARRMSRAHRRHDALRRPAHPGVIRRLCGRIPALGAAVEELPRLCCRRQRGRRQGRAAACCPTSGSRATRTC